MSEGLDPEALRAAIAGRGPIVRVVIAAFRGSTPRETGAAMLVWEDGQSGTIGGGALELEAARAARALLVEPPLPWARQVVRLPLGPALGQCCGGVVTLLLERIGAEELSGLEAARAAGCEVFARPVASGRPPGADFAERIRHGAARSGRETAPGLRAGVMSEPFARMDAPLWIFGAGHVGRAIVQCCTDLPFAVTWVDTGPERFPAEIPGAVTRLIAADPARAAAHAPAEAIHLVLTYSHAIDLAICHTVLARPFRHLGLIGSVSKKARFLSRLRALGHDEATLSRLACPIGDPALGKRPAAIAVGVAAELLRLPAACVTIRAARELCA